MNRIELLRLGDDILITFFISYCSVDKIELVVNKQKQHNNLHQYPDYSHCTDEEIDIIDEKFRHGCKAIFHRQGYMNSKGDAPYDFTCDHSHLCEKCKKFREVAITPLKGRKKVTLIKLRLQKSFKRIHRK